jgi:hypothetical protein
LCSVRCIENDSSAANAIRISDIVGMRADMMVSLHALSAQVDDPYGAWVHTVTESTERWGWTTLGTILILLLLHPTIESPDGLEMLRLTGQWLGHATTVGDPLFWPPLWSVLNIPSVALGQPVIGAHLLNQVLWGLTIWPLHLLTCCLADRHAARRAVMLYLLLPMLLSFGPVLDARPLGTLITTGFVAAAVHQGMRNRGLVAMLLLAALAPLARPEGIILPVIAAGCVWLLHRGWKQALGAGVLTLLPHLALRSSLRGMTGHEQLYGPWYGTWSTWDMLSLFGPASVPTEFRQFALAAIEQGVVDGQPTPSDILGLLVTIPSGLMGMVLTVLGAVGVVGLLLAGRGLWGVLPTKRRWITLALIVVTPLAIGAAPMAKDQAGPLSNYLFLMPGLVALTAIGAANIRPSWPRWAPLGLLGAVLLEAHFTPLQSPPPYFLEGSESAQLATVMLTRSAPENGLVATDFSGRSVVLAAGLTPRPLGSPWLGPISDEITAVLINSVGASGEDGGRTLKLLESTEWRVEWVVGDEDLAMADPTTQPLPGRPRWDRGWFALLVRR